MGLINSVNSDNFNFSLAGISDPTDEDSDSDNIPDGWEFCYSVYGEFLPMNDYRWSLNPVSHWILIMTQIQTVGLIGKSQIFQHHRDFGRRDNSENILGSGNWAGHTTTTFLKLDGV